ncbi:MAG: LysR substrate-binding domain-containing protein [Pseudomonadota bacterium]
MSRLPPLRGLEAFVAAGEMGSFIKAAQSLNLTPSAFSRRIKGLEDDLGLDLFDRINREVRLTEPGKRLFSRIAPSFEALHDACDEARGQSRQWVLRLGIPPGFAKAFVMPRLSDWRRRAPSTQLQFDTAPQALSRLGHDLDAAIVYESDLVSRDLLVQEIGRFGIFPIVSPELLASMGDEPTPRDFAKLPRLVLSNIRDMTDEWLAMEGYPPTKPVAVSTFNSGPIMVDAAASGLGMGFTFEFLARPYLDSGRLVRLSDKEIESPVTYYFVCQHKRMDEHVMRQLRQWLVNDMPTIRAA